MDKFTSQTNKKRISRKIILILMVLTIFFILAFFPLSWLVKAFPFIKGSKDWLDILSALGQAAGVVVLIGLVYEMYHQELENKRRCIPAIEISLTVVTERKIPDGAIGCLTEKFQPPKSLESSDQYQDVWDILDPERATHYLRVEVSNNQWEREGQVQDFQMNIEFTYGEGEDPTTDRGAKIFWCPQKGIDIPTGNRPTVFFIRCGKHLNPRLTYFSGKITDYRCVNLRGDSFKGEQLGYHPRLIPRQPFRDQTEIAE